MEISRFVSMLALTGVILCAQAEPRSESAARTVIGPSNIDLADGASALKMGDAEEGVRLTQRGLRTATSKRDRVAAYSNLCAGLVMLGRLEEALESCNQALVIDDEHWRSYSNRALVYIKQQRYVEAEHDIARGQAINPNARTLKIVKAMLLDATDPVSPSIIIDDRREDSAGDADD